ncbi:DUF397 domain-containing protein [Streptomyces sp. UH6]|uniref:DUF397 domain-containing protein n=1 Tax=Streptomyces sp. UH6 TaxID=2748379 RepID=UPI0035BC90AA
MDHDVYDGYDLDEASERPVRPAVPVPLRVHNGMAATRLEGVAWQKSRHSNSQGSCVEFARLPGGEVAVRNSRFPDGPALVYTRAEIEAMLLGVKDGEFDHLIAG